MLSQEEVFLFVIRLLEKLRVPYMIVGSYASSYYGVPRSTHDADIILVWQSTDIDAFVSKLGPDFYADADDLKNSLRETRISNIIHLETGFKIDLSPLGNSAFFQHTLNRRRERIILGQKAYFASPEDVILLKLLWAKQSESNRQIEDARGILLVQGKNLDQNYLLAKAKDLSVIKLLEKIRPG